MLRIWFNRTYATNAHIIALLRENPDGEPVRVYGTHADPTSPVLAACDVTEPEPDETVTGDAYVQWALDFCRRHHIDVLVPRLHLDTIAAARDRFAAAGVAVVAGPSGPSALMEDKAAAYEDAREAGLPVPPYRVVSNGDELRDAYADLFTEVGAVCMKPVTGVGGRGFRILTHRPPTIDDVLGDLQPRVHVAETAAALDAHAASGGQVPPLMVMAYMPGAEVSVDCLADHAGDLLAAVPRTKVGRKRLLVDDPGAVEVAAALVKRHKLASLSNTQVRYWRHPALDSEPRPYLLETNARISGGLYQTAMTGVNLPWAAVRLALGRPVAPLRPRLGISFTTVSSVVAASVAEDAAGRSGATHTDR